MSQEESERHLKARMSDVSEILKLHSEGKSIQDISTKVRVGLSYTVDVLKKGYDTMEQEIASQYGMKLVKESTEPTTKEGSSQKKETKTEQDFLCVDCNKVLKQIDDVVHEGYTFRMYRCLKCKKVYPHPQDSQNYLYEVKK